MRNFRRRVIFLEFFEQFSADKVNIDSIIKATSRAQYLAERRIVEIKEIADAAANFLIDTTSGTADVAALLPFAFDGEILPAVSVNPDTMAEGVDAVRAYSAADSALDGAELAELLIASLAERGVTLGEADFLSRSKRPETFAYVKNPFADEAYDVFSSEFSDPRVIYAKSFKEALNLVESGEAGYCLLPLEERGARLATIGELIFRGDFKINSVTPVFGFDGLADMKYALLSKSFSIPDISPDDDRYLEVRLSGNRGDDISDILLCAKRYGVSVYRINSSIYDLEGRCELYYSIVFKGDGGDFTRLLTYLAIFAGGYTPVGIYKNLE